MRRSSEAYVDRAFTWSCADFIGGRVWIRLVCKNAADSAQILRKRSMLRKRLRTDGHLIRFAAMVICYSEYLSKMLTKYN